MEAQAWEIYQLWAQLARVTVRDAPPLPALSAPEIDMAVPKDRLAHCMRITLANLRVYVAFKAGGGIGEIERSMEFQGQHDPATMNPGDLFPWRTWDCFQQS